MKDRFQINELITLMNDGLKNKIAIYNENASKFTDQAVREAFFELLGEDKLTWQNFRNYHNEIFTIIENVLKVNLPGAWENSPFYNQFVEVKRGDLGVENSFIVEDNSILVASNFSGNHWDTKRQEIQGAMEFSVPTGWIYIRVYNDLERFLTANDSLATMVAKLQKSLQAEIDARIFAAFNGAGTFLPAKFKETGTYDRDTMNEIIERVQTYSQKDVVLAGSRTALAHITDGMNTAWISNSQKEEMATTGMVLENIGLPAKAIVIPQAFIRGTYDFKVSTNTIHILPEGSKIIKMFYEGDVRARDLGAQDTHDQTIDSQVQVKLGIGVICDSITGRYDIV